MKKKITTTSELFTVLATAELTTYHYKIWLLLATEPLTQTQIAEKLFVKKQNIRKHIADLERLGLITTDRIEGRNKFLTAVTKLPNQMPNKDQMSLFDTKKSK